MQGKELLLLVVFVPATTYVIHSCTVAADKEEAHAQREAKEERQAEEERFSVNTHRDGVLDISVPLKTYSSDDKFKRLELFRLCKILGVILKRGEYSSVEYYTLRSPISLVDVYGRTSEGDGIVVGISRAEARKANLSNMSPQTFERFVRLKGSVEFHQALQ